jgi:hypothetical protein
MMALSLTLLGWPNPEDSTEDSYRGISVTLTHATVRVCAARLPS